MKEKKNTPTPAELLRNYFLTESQEVIDADWNAVKDLECGGVLVEDFLNSMDDSLVISNEPIEINQPDFFDFNRVYNTMVSAFFSASELENNLDYNSQPPSKEELRLANAA